jgi:ABC-type branched-subunit amino acid transport system ATPase component
LPAAAWSARSRCQKAASGSPPSRTCSRAATGQQEQNLAAAVVIEQDALRALAVSARSYVLVTGQVAFEGSAADIAGDERLRSGYLGGRRAQQIQ